MKFLIVLSFGISTIFVSAQDSTQNKYPEPKWAMDIIYYDSIYPHGLQLEKLHGEEKTNANAALHVTGIGKVKSKVVFSNSNSTVRLKESDTLIFIARFTANCINPSEILNLYKVESTSKRREIETGSLGTFSGFSTAEVEHISFSADAYGESSYIIYLTNLPPGEYAFGFSTSYDTFMLFGVDEVYEDPLPEALNVGDSAWFLLDGEWTPRKIIKDEDEYYILEYSDKKNKNRKIRRKSSSLYSQKPE